MKQRIFVIITLFFVLLISMAFTPKEKKVLIIGDSISIGYTPYVKEALSGKAQVFHNPGNAQHSGVGLKNIREWIGGNDWDVIQFNWGLWDLCYRSPVSKVQGNRDKINGKITLSVEEYKTNLDSIVSILKRETTAQLLFVTTTFVPEDEEGRFYEDATVYNDAAIEIMEKHGVAVNDIYDKSASIHKRFGMGSDNVHYTKEGYEALSREIVPLLRNLLKIEK